MKKYFLFILLINLNFILACAATEADMAWGQEQTAEIIQVQIGGKTYQTAFYDNPSAKALIERLPLTLTMGDLNQNEKYYYLPDGLPTNSESVSQIRTGDIMLYGSDCLVIFYRDFSTSYRYTRLGRVENAEDLATIVGSGNIQVTITKVSKEN